MLERRADPTRFPTARCTSCNAPALTYLTTASDGSLKRACVRCDSAITTALNWVDTTGLGEIGFEEYSGAGRSRGCAKGCGCASQANRVPGQ